MFSKTPNIICYSLPGQTKSHFALLWHLKHIFFPKARPLYETATKTQSKPVKIIYWLAISQFLTYDCEAKKKKTIIIKYFCSNLSFRNNADDRLVVSSTRKRRMRRSSGHECKLTNDSSCRSNESTL